MHAGRSQGRKADDVADGVARKAGLGISQDRAAEIEKAQKNSGAALNLYYNVSQCDS